MDKDLKQMKYVNRHSGSLKRITVLSFLAAIQAASCAGGSRQGFRDSSKDVDLSLVPQGTPEFNRLQAKTANIVSEKFAESNAKWAEKHAELVKSNKQNAFFQAIQQCNLKRVASLLSDPLDGPFITSKEVTEGLMLALKHNDTLSFRYKHEKIVHFLLEKCNLTSEDLSAQDESGSTLLHLLIKRGDIRGVQRLVGKYALEKRLLCAKDSKGRTPMDLAALCKSKKIVKLLFDQISKLDKALAIQMLISAIRYSYLPRNRNFAALLNNSHVQVPTFYRKGSEIFKHIIQTAFAFLTFDQLMSIANEIDDIEYSGVLSSVYARSLRHVIKPYIEKRAAESGKKISRYEFHKAQEARNRHCINGQYSSSADEGYVSSDERLDG